MSDEDPAANSEVRLGATGAGAQLAALCLAVAGVLFVLYPSIRPFSDEVSISGAEAFASNAWLVAHSSAMLGFILVVLGLFGVYTRLRTASALAAPSLIVTWIGVGLTLPYYGAETFGLHAIGQEAVRQHNAGLLSIANNTRWELGIWFFLPGLLLVGVGVTLFAITVWRCACEPRWAGIPMALGFGLFIPQFFTSQPVRIAHGVLIAIGCFLLAWSVLWKREAGPITARVSGTRRRLE